MNLFDEMLTIEELAEYLPEKPKKSTIYRWTHKGLIPYHNYGKKLLFDKNKIDKWNDSGRPAN